MRTIRAAAAGLLIGALLLATSCARTDVPSAQSKENSTMTSSAPYSSTTESAGSESFTSEPTTGVSTGTTISYATTTTTRAVTIAPPTKAPTKAPTKTATTAPATTAGRKPGEPLTLALTDKALKFMGRAKVTETEAWLDWSASSMELNVKGGRVRVQVSASDSNDTNCVYLGVYVDGERTQKLRCKNGLQWYTIADNLPAGSVTNVKLVRLNEAAMGKATISSVEITGETAAPTPAAKRKIEWIGDSITAGYGVLAKESDPFTSETEDASYTYPVLVSESLGADYHVLAASGFGVATSNGGSTTDGLLPKVYPYTSFPRGTFKTNLWTYSQFQPDLVVINLGTNDYAGSGGAQAARLQTGIKSFLTTVRAAHPQAKIVWAYGFMIDGFSKEIKTAVEDFARADGNVSYVQLPRQNAANGYGSGGHPNAASHLSLAASLSATLEALMGW